jgi:hypothetical protein
VSNHDDEDDQEFLKFKSICFTNKSSQIKLNQITLVKLYHFINNLINKSQSQNLA